MNENLLHQIIEAVLFAAHEPVSIEQISAVFTEAERPERKAIRDVLQKIAAECTERGIELKELASGFQFQVKKELSPWIGRLWEEKPARYSRALLETLALIAYRQPITRGEIEAIRGVVVSSQMMRTLIEHGWVRVVGYKDVPGKPALHATTKQFLDHFGLKSLSELPTLKEIQDLAQYDAALEQAIITEELAEAAEPSEDIEPQSVTETELAIAAPEPETTEIIFAQDETEKNIIEFEESSDLAEQTAELEEQSEQIEIVEY